MPKLVFKVSSDYQEVIRLRQECEKLEAQLKKMDVNKSPAAAKALETSNPTLSISHLRDYFNFS
jgi:hypothetical protein